MCTCYYNDGDVMKIKLFFNCTRNKLMTAINVGSTEYICSYDGYRYNGAFFEEYILNSLGWELIGEI